MSWRTDLEYYYLFRGDKLVGYEIVSPDGKMYSGKDWDCWHRSKKHIKFDDKVKTSRKEILHVLERRGVAQQ